MKLNLTKSKINNSASSRCCKGCKKVFTNRYLICLLGFASIILFRHTHLNAQNLVDEILNGGKLQQTNFLTVVPFEYENGLIIVHAKMGNDKKEYRFILDNTAPTQVSYQLARTGNVFPLTSKKIVIPGNNNEGHYGRIASIDFGGLIFHDMGAQIASFSRSSYQRCSMAQIDGVLGGNLLRLMVMRIDYTRKELTLSDNRFSMPALPNTDTLSFSTNTCNGEVILDEPVYFNGTAISNVKISLRQPAKFVSTPRHLRKLRRRGTPAVYAHAILYQDDDTLLIKGIIGYARASNFTLGNTKAYGIVGEFSDSYKNSGPEIGNKFLERYIATFDYRTQDIFLAPISNKNQSLNESVPADSITTMVDTTLGTYGIYYLRIDSKDALVVSLVIDNSKAAIAGVVPGIIITSLNEIDTRNLTSEGYCKLLDINTLPSSVDKSITMQYILNGIAGTIVLMPFDALAASFSEAKIENKKWSIFRR